MAARLIILAGFASAIILGALALQMALTVEVELKPLPRQNRDAIAELGETVKKRVLEEEARRQARARGEDVPEPEARPFPRDRIIAMMASSPKDREELEQILAGLGPASAPAKDESHGMPELDELTQLAAITYAHEVHRLVKFDANRDGVLDRTELERSAGTDMPPLRSPFRKADEILAAHDLNQDGLVSRDELMGSYRFPFGIDSRVRDAHRENYGDED